MNIIGGHFVKLILEHDLCNNTIMNISILIVYIRQKSIQRYKLTKRFDFQRTKLCKMIVLHQYYLLLRNVQQHS